MVSAVFHSPLSAAAESSAIKNEAAHAHSTRATGSNDSKNQATSPTTAPPKKPGYDWGGLVLTVLPPLLGLALLVGIWALVSAGTAGSIPSPLDTAKPAVDLFSDPFYR